MKLKTPTLCLALVLLGSTSHAIEWSGLRLEQVKVSRCHEGSLVLHVTDIAIDGVLRDRPSSRFRLVIDGKPLTDRPSGARTFADTGALIHVALVLEASLAYSADLEQIITATKAFVRALPKKSTVTVVTYSEEVALLHSRKTPRQALLDLEQIVPLDGVDLSLIDALKAAIKDLGRLPSTERRMIVVLSDGINRDPAWDLFRSLGSRARKLRLPISPIGYSPIDERGPLLSLGELAKRSFGTFRWSKTASEIPQQLRNLGHEISGQRVLTFPIDQSRCGQSLRVSVAIDGQRSNEMLVSPTKQSAATKRGPWLAIAGLVGVVLALAFVTWLMLKGGKQRRKTTR